MNLDAVWCGFLLGIRAIAPGYFYVETTFNVNDFPDASQRQNPLTREAFLMNYPLLPADAAAYAWQLSCCLVTLLFAMFSWMIGPR